MESRLIYKSNTTYLNKVTWDFVNKGSEWYFIGNENINEEKIIEIINQTFLDNSLFIVLGRDDSHEIQKSEIIKKVVATLKYRDFSVWDNKFHKVIQFNKNGICRVGTRVIS